MTNFKLKLAVSLVLSSAVFTFVKAQEPKEEIIKINTYLVNIPVIVSDKDGRYIAGLTKENFTIIQDGLKQEIEYFASSEAPMNVAILLDMSGSTMRLIGDIRSAAKKFIEVLRPEDRCLIATFENAPNILTPFTPDQKALKKAIERSRPVYGYGSNMNDALYRLLIKEFASVTGRKAVIVLTDGMVGGIAVSNDQLLYKLSEQDVMVYPILFDINRFTGKNFIRRGKWKLPTGETISDEEMRKRIETVKQQMLKFMTSLGTITGGRIYNSNDFKKSFQSIADELKKQYVVGFYPQNVDDGKSHQVSVEVNPSNIFIRTKRNIQLKLSGN